MPLGRLKKAARNPKRHDREQIAASLKRFGYVELIVLDERTKRLVAGHGRVEQFEEARAAGREPPQGVKVAPGGEWLVPVARGWRSRNDREAEGYLLASNKIGELGGWDDADLAAVLRDLGDGGLLGTGFDLDDLAAISGGADPSAATSLQGKFLVPPFSVLDARQGYWRERKEAWLALGIQSELGRGEDLRKFSKTVQLKPRKTRFGTSGMAFDGGQLKGRPPQSGTSLFDPVLCEVAYRWFCPTAGSILDPFAGGSVRGVVASRLGHRYVGVDLRGEQVAANRAQGKALCTGFPTPKWIEGDSRALPKLLKRGDSFDLVFSCPPYGDLEEYSDDPRDLSAMKLDDFQAAYAEVIRASVSRLRPNRFAVFVVGDYRLKDGTYADFVSGTIDAFRRAGAALYNEAILVTAVGTLSMRVGTFFPRGRKLGKSHQNVLVFWKGDPGQVHEALGEVEIPAEALGTAEEAP